MQSDSWWKSKDKLGGQAGEGGVFGVSRANFHAPAVDLQNGSVSTDNDHECGIVR